MPLSTLKRNFGWKLAKIWWTRYSSEDHQQAPTELQIVITDNMQATRQRRKPNLLQQGRLQLINNISCNRIRLDINSRGIRLLSFRNRNVAFTYRKQKTR